jgi:hypothetical protein
VLLAVLEFPVSLGFLGNYSRHPVDPAYLGCLDCLAYLENPEFPADLEYRQYPNRMDQSNIFLDLQV